jgi:hypothetical protein
MSELPDTNFNNSIKTKVMSTTRTKALLSKLTYVNFFNKIKTKVMSTTRTKALLIAVTVLIVSLFGVYIHAQISHAGSNCTGKTYYSGTSGKCVSDIQTLVNSFTGSKLVVDGIYGPLTKAAVTDFQKKAFSIDKTQWDGIVGPKTWNKICNYVPENKTKSVHEAQLDACGKAAFKLSTIDSKLPSEPKKLSVTLSRGTDSPASRTYSPELSTCDLLKLENKNGYAWVYIGYSDNDSAINTINVLINGQTVSLKPSQLPHSFQMIPGKTYNISATLNYTLASANGSTTSQSCLGSGSISTTKVVNLTSPITNDPVPVNSAVITWTDTNNKDASYIVEATLNKKNGETDPQPCKTTLNSCTFDNLLVLRDYTFSVKAVNSVGSSDSINTNSIKTYYKDKIYSQDKNLMLNGKTYKFIGMNVQGAASSEGINLQCWGSGSDLNNTTDLNKIFDEFPDYSVFRIPAYQDLALNPYELLNKDSKDNVTFDWTGLDYVFNLAAYHHDYLIPII